MPNHTYNKSLLLGFLLVFVALIVNTVLAYWNVQRLQSNAQAVSRQHFVMGELQQLYNILLNAETGQRGYLITGQQSFLQPYQKASMELQEKLRTVDKLVSTTPERQKLFGELETSVANRMELISKSINLREKDGIEAVSNWISAGEGKRAMDQVRSQISAIEAKEREVLEQRAAESRVSYWTALITGLISSALGLGLVISGFVLVSRDMAQRQQLSEALQKSKEKLEDRVRARTMEIEASNNALRDEIDIRTKAETTAMQAAQELQRSNRELEQFASVASHDLQEPLRKIQAFGDRLQLHCNEQLGERGIDYLQRILVSAARMRKLIDDLLTYSRVASKAQPFTAVDLNDVAEEVVGDLEGRLQDVGGVVELGKLPHLEADPMQMRQLFLNLIANALKFHRPGVPPVVKVTAQTIATPPKSSGDTSAAPAAYCEITVQDNGIGFEQVYVDRIFELFQRLHGRDEYQGTGMGLAICRKIVERHAGTITAQSEPGQGSCFIFTLPIQQRAALPATTAVTRPANPISNQELRA
ncbi:Phytochrome-like protein cph1 [Anatilimnocola aggregata]|uniref:histidine kinase n=1 Tax=Anatilimnocola aggregata TaxID=2528021 RepID=A0A517Y9F5_9BACT|nr:sensor histidine kinase [Anatilimnocola aggregata]QDU26865.1 Phytochrome-like protein cph1 [Anatilimnocola aggregata]